MKDIDRNFILNQWILKIQNMHEECPINYRKVTQFKKLIGNNNLCLF